MRGVFFLLIAMLGMCQSACSREAPAIAGTSAATSTSTSTHRVAVLSPALAVIVRDLGYANQVVARHAYDDVLPKHLPAAGDQAGIDYEALLRVKPTHVLVQWGARQLPDRLVQLAASEKWAVVNSNPLSLADIAQAVRDIDSALNEDAATTPSVTAQKQLDALSQFLAPATATTYGPILILASTNPPAALGPGSCHHELLVAVGGEPAIKTGTPWMEMSHEDLVRLAPRAIILIRPKSARGVTDSDAPVRESSNPWEPLIPLNLSAVRDGNIAVIDDPEGLLPSTSMIRVGEAMRKAVGAWK